MSVLKAQGGVAGFFSFTLLATIGLLATRTKVNAVIFFRVSTSHSRSRVPEIKKFRAVKSGGVESTAFERRPSGSEKARLESPTLVNGKFLANWGR